MSKYITIPPIRCKRFTIFSRSRAANAARAMAAMTSSTMAGVFPPIAAALPIIPPLAAAVAPMIPAKTTSDSPSPAENGVDVNENSSSSALDQAMAATLAAIEVPESQDKTGKV